MSSALSSAATNPSPSFLLLLTHYPLLDRDGSDYSAGHRFHGVDNGSAMIDALRRGLAAYLRPSAGGPSRGAALLHGHVHKGYRVDFQVPFAASAASAPSPSPVAPSRSASAPSTAGSVRVPVLNPGSAGRSFAAGQRAAAYGVYTIAHTGDDSTSGQWRVTVERFVHNGETFEREEEPFTSPY